MKALDRILQAWRIAKALPYVRTGARLLDVGCFDLALLRKARPRVSRAVGIDPLAEPVTGEIQVVQGTLPHGHPFGSEQFDCITMLAVLEHVSDVPALAAECRHLLAPGGRVVLTVPHPLVDRVLDVLARLRLIDGMSLDEHHGFERSATAPAFESAGLALVRRRLFQFGLNCLYVFEKPR